VSGLARTLRLGVVLALTLPAAAVAAPRVSAPGNHDLTLTIGDRTRTFVVHVPPGGDARGPLPALVAFHGGGGDARGFQAYAGLDRVADREGFVVVYPDGTGPLPRRLLTWNAGGCCGRAHATGADDVAFTLALLRDLARELPIDATRVYVTGHSNGSMMAYRLAAEASPHVAAVAAVAGMMTLERIAPARPVPVLHIHSLDDPRALYGGGLGPPFPLTDVRVTHRPVVDGLAQWVALDHCAAEPQVSEVRRATARAGEHAATLLTYEPCAGDAVVAHWRLTGAGHGWPGSRSPLAERIMGPDTTVIDAAEEIWRFVRRFTRPDAPPLR
jgi:polyhydroxybutyrate depolymerase